MSARAMGSSRSASCFKAQPKAAASQTLMRGLDVIEAVRAGCAGLADVALKVGLTTSTTYRLATALVERGYLAATPRAGYRLGPKLLALGHAAQHRLDLIEIARPHIEALAAATQDSVQLGIFDQDQALCVDKVAGRRRVNIACPIGEYLPLGASGLGRALMLDHGPVYWLTRFAAERAAANVAALQRRMADYAARGVAYHVEENADRIRSVAAPVRNAGGHIVAAISLSSAAQYMDDGRLEDLSLEVKRTAAAISRDLGNEAAR